MRQLPRIRGQSPEAGGQDKGLEEVSSEGFRDLESGIVTGRAQNCSYSFPCFRVRLGCLFQQTGRAVLTVLSAGLGYCLVPRCQTERGGVAMA